MDMTRKRTIHENLGFLNILEISLLSDGNHSSNFSVTVKPQSKAMLSKMQHKIEHNLNSSILNLG